MIKKKNLSSQFLLGRKRVVSHVQCPNFSEGASHRTGFRLASLGALMYPAQSNHTEENRDSHVDWQIPWLLSSTQHRVNKQKPQLPDSPWQGKDFFRLLIPQLSGGFLQDWLLTCLSWNVDVTWQNLATWGLVRTEKDLGWQSPQYPFMFQHRASRFFLKTQFPDSPCGGKKLDRVSNDPRHLGTAKNKRNGLGQHERLRGPQNCWPG